MTLWSAGKPPGLRVCGILIAPWAKPPNHTPRVPRERRRSSTSTLQAAAQKASHRAASLPPLAVLPTKVLLRSLLVATISSKPLLLRSSFWAMSILSKPNRGFLLNVDRNPILHGILKKTFYEQFCAGENGAETKATINELKGMGFRGVIMTYAKETVFDHSTNMEQGIGVSALESETKGQSLNTQPPRCANIEAWRKGTMETVEQLEDSDYLAVKYDPSQTFTLHIKLTFL